MDDQTDKDVHPMVELQIEYLPHYQRDQWGDMKYAHAGDSGFDLRASIEEPLLLTPSKVHKIPTGIIARIPAGYELQVRPRSGAAAKGLTVTNAPGTVDAGYRGEINVLVHLVAHRVLRIDPGERIAQAVLAPVVRANLVDADGEDTAVDDRGANGFGSSGSD